MEIYTGCLEDPKDDRDLIADPILGGSDEVDWEKGFDIEKELSIKIPFKNQRQSRSCVGQGWSYYLAVLDAAETGLYDENSAKAIYSQIYLDSGYGGAYIRDGGKLAVNWGSLTEKIVASQPATEEFMRDKTWKTPENDRLAKVLQSKEYRKIIARINMDLFAKSIRDYYGVVSGLNGENNGSWGTGEPKPPENMTFSHALYFGKFGIDDKGKYIATPNSWGERQPDDNHPDGWQRIRQDYFDSGHMFNPWTLIDKPNNMVKLIKEKDSSTVYVESVDGMYYPIAYEKFALDMFGGSWSNITVEVVDSLPKDKIGYPIGGYNS